MGVCGKGDVHGKGGMQCGGGGHVWQRGACMAGGMHSRGSGRGDMCAGEMATEVGGMQPTGMHSCFHSNLYKNTNIANNCV